VLWNQIYEKDLEPALGKSLAEQLATESLFPRRAICDLDFRFDWQRFFGDRYFRGNFATFGRGNLRWFQLWLDQFDCLFSFDC
jgi:hypothetical protein